MLGPLAVNLELKEAKDKIRLSLTSTLRRLPTAGLTQGVLLLEDLVALMEKEETEARITSEWWPEKDTRIK